MVNRKIGRFYDTVVCVLNCFAGNQIFVSSSWQ